ncbi:phosphotransferase family protein [Pseudohoeflea suaedae]|uniref:Phosphotransferase family protein n=1 Tax=Pseudohoeflea suaedae TaxID=877384 RepID=A0A4R5PKD8_9HYPH|nr:phosphotransferase family protein [Pseudohoeflea suaedae]TDH36096.1 phosphotransferase family protein [Pseudohoeflea suaedae]
MSAAIDTAAFAGWLRANDLGDLETIEAIAGGQSNPTFFLRAGGKAYVLRKKPGGPILKGAHAVDREYRVLTALSQTKVPVPEPVAFCDDTAVLGTEFYLMERLEGRVFHDASLPGLDPDERRAIYLSMAETLARLHAVRPDEVGLGDYGRPTGYFGRQYRRWLSQWQAAEGMDIPELDRLAAWLGDHLPEDDGQVAIVHGDYRIGNLIYHPTEPEVVGILDWELSTLGHPLADLGFCCMAWRTTPEEYGGIRGLGAEAEGIPSRKDFVAHYMGHAISAAPLAPVHEAFALFRFAVIFVGIAERARQGNAAGAEAERLAPLAGRFAARGLELIA